MSDLVFISFPSEAKAEEVRQKILDMQSDYLIEVGDAVIATKDEKGRVKLNQLVHTTAIGATGGAFWGLLVGWIFLMPLAGAAIGAASGALSGALTDVGIRDDKMKQAAQALKPGEALITFHVGADTLLMQSVTTQDGSVRVSGMSQPTP